MLVLEIASSLYPCSHHEIDVQGTLEKDQCLDEEKEIEGARRDGQMLVGTRMGYKMSD